MIRHYTALAFFAATQLLTESVWAQNIFQSAPFVTQSEDLSQQVDVKIHPFSRSANAAPRLTRSFGPASLDDAVKSVLRQYGLQSRLQMREKTAPGFGLVGSPSRIKSYDFYIGSVKLCDYQVKAIQVTDGDPIVVGALPKISADTTPPLEDWGDINDAVLQLQIYADRMNLKEEFELAGYEPCFMTENREVIPAWSVTLRGSSGLHYTGIAGNYRVWRLNPRYFDVDGKAKIYPNNITDTALQEFTLKGLFTSGKLENQYFRTVMQNSADPVATAADYQFFYAPNTSEFAQTSLFTNANRALDWFSDHGYKSFGDKQISIQVHAELAVGGPNNALYEPDDGSGSPIIRVGDGDGVLLQNMATDTDVVGHEFGHHVIYSSVTSIEGESLVLHEGLADFFDFARTDDPCLGESICPSDNKINCPTYKGKLCLRTAANTYVLGNPSLPTEAHLRSQFISGMLWDLRETDKIPVADLNNIVLLGIENMPARSRYEHLILGMLITDRASYKGAYCDKILKRARERGLTQRVADLSCTGTLPDPDTYAAGTTATSASPSSGSSSRGGSRGGICGVVGAVGGDLSLASLLTMLSPLLLGLRRRRR